MQRRLASRLSFGVAVSAGLLVPCFWQPVVSHGDLQSHLYNAWLANLVRGGQAPGLTLEWQWTNVLVDLILERLLGLVSASAAERLLTSCAVLLFFWGAFCFVSRVQSQRAQALAPWLAILTYGYVFQMGLINYFVSAGLALWALVATWEEGPRLRWLAAAGLLLFAWLAHPIPVLWFIGITAYRHIAKQRPKRQGVLFVAGVMCLVGVHVYVRTRYVAGWSIRQVSLVTGADQALLYKWRDLPVMLCMACFFAVLLASAENRRRVMTSIPAQLYGLTAAAIVLIPTGFRRSPLSTWSTLIAERLSLLAAILLLAALPSPRTRRWPLIAGLACAVAFFGLLYDDAARASRLERRMEDLVSALPAGARVIGYLPAGRAGDSGSLERVRFTHLLARACIGRCFDYMNYEPASGQFRIHASAHNPWVAGRIQDVYAMEEGIYAARPEDPPLHSIQRCGPGMTDLCVGELGPGQSSRDIAYLQRR